MYNRHVGHVMGRYYPAATGNQNIAIGTKAMASEPKPVKELTAGNRPSVFSVYDK